MRTRGKAEVRLAPPLPDDHVFGLGLSDRHRVMKDVWHAQQQIVKLAFHRLRDSKLALAGIGHLAQTFLECLARQNLAFSDMIGGSDNAFRFHTLDASGGAIVADLKMTRDKA